MSAEVIYFFTEDFINANETRLKPCGCDDEDCTILVFDNLNELPSNRDPSIIYVDFSNKKRM